MAAAILNRVRVAIYRFEVALDTLLGKSFPPESICLAAIEIDKINQPPRPKFSFKEILGDGFLWATPKSRRTIEKRQKRLYGSPEYGMKILQPKTNLRTCNTCGDDHEVGVLCPTCYKKVLDETKEMQEAIVNELKLKPVEKEVVVLYEGEKDDQPAEFYKGKRIIEMKKSRPSWFSKNLLQQTTQQNSTATDVKPSDLS